jgi:hypothetical protein
MGIRWQFLEKETGDDVSWTWRALHPDGTLSDSRQAFPSYGAAVHDAIRHGFMPSEQDWSVTSGRSVVNYHFSANPPAITSRRPGKPAGPGEPESQPPPRPVSGGSATRRKR